MARSSRAFRRPGACFTNASVIWSGVPKSAVAARAAGSGARGEMVPPGFDQAVTEFVNHVGGKSSSKVGQVVIDQLVVGHALVSSMIRWSALNGGPGTKVTVPGPLLRVVLVHDGVDLDLHHRDGHVSRHLRLVGCGGSRPPGRQLDGPRPWSSFGRASCATATRGPDTAPQAKTPGQAGVEGFCPSACVTGPTSLENVDGRWSSLNCGLGPGRATRPQ